VDAGSSGHFFNFGDVTSNPPLEFHLLTRGLPDDNDNLEVYTDDNTLRGGPVEVYSLNCTLRRVPR
jgi:hypothetical protein